MEKNCKQCKGELVTLLSEVSKEKSEVINLLKEQNELLEKRNYDLSQRIEELERLLAER